MMRTRQLHARLAYVVRVDNHASIAYTAASARSVRRGLLSTEVLSQSILEILKTITIVIVFKISKMDCDTDT